jgi:hypothetical protein
MNKRLRFILAAALFLGWMSWLGYAALSKNRGPIVSHAQAAGATQAVIADLTDGANGKPSQLVTVVEPLKQGSPVAGSRQFVTNLPQTQGYAGPGRYLLLLTPDPEAVMVREEGTEMRPLQIVGQQRSPGFDLAGVGPQMIYADTPAVRQQAEKLLK